jgi:hypothetical protein
MLGVIPEEGHIPITVHTGDKHRDAEGRIFLSQALGKEG